MPQPQHGAFFQPGDDALRLLGPGALCLVSAAAVRAPAAAGLPRRRERSALTCPTRAQVLGVVSKRGNKPVTEAVFAALTSLPARKLSSGHQRLNAAVDRVFDSVLNQEFVRAHLSNLELDDFI